MADKIETEITQSLAAENFEAVAARLPELQDCIAQALAAAPDDASRERILSDVLATHRRWLNLTRSLKAQAAKELQSLAAQQGYLGQERPGGHIVQSVG